MNILTIDIEEMFPILGYENCSQKINYTSRIESELSNLLNILFQTKAKATFFIVAEVAKSHPELILKISQHFDIGIHGYKHIEATKLSLKNFKYDILKAKDTVETITNKKITKYRAPGFAINKEYLKILFDCGINSDSSCSSIEHQFGKKILAFAKPYIFEYEGKTLKEFPPSTIKIFGKYIGFIGGGYFRLFPYNIIKKQAQTKQEYMLTYIHPSDIDANKPIIRNLPLKRYFKSYVGIKKTEKKLIKFLNDFQFTDIHTAKSEIDWKKVEKIEL